MKESYIREPLGKKMIGPVDQRSITFDALFGGDNLDSRPFFGRLGTFRSCRKGFQGRPRLQNLFWQMDDDESGTLTADEMQELVKDPKMAAYFTALGDFL